MRNKNTSANRFHNNNKIWLCFIVLSLCFAHSEEVKAQCTAFTVTGGGTICSGATGPAIGLSGSQSGLTYQLKNGAANVGSAKAGTGGALNWTNNATAGTYTIIATKSTAPTCTLTMTGSATVIVNPLPSLFTVSGGGAICSGATGPTVTLSSSKSGVNYQLKRGGTSVGSALAGTGAALSWTNNTTAGTYTVIATNATTPCTATMTGNAVVTVNALPTVYTVSGGGNYCSGSTGVSVNQSSSQSGVNYQLQMGGVNSGLAISGTGAALVWANMTTAGTYTVIAINVSDRKSVV